MINNFFSYSWEWLALRSPMKHVMLSVRSECCPARLSLFLWIIGLALMYVRRIIIFIIINSYQTRVPLLYSHACLKFWFTVLELNLSYLVLTMNNVTCACCISWENKHYHRDYILSEAWLGHGTVLSDGGSRIFVISWLDPVIRAEVNNRKLASKQSDGD